VQKVGFRAVDLARVSQKKYPVPLSFVIPCEVLGEFLTQSGIAVRLPRIYSSHPDTVEGYAQAYGEIRELFGRVKFSGEIRERLLEAYESLAIPTGARDASRLVTGLEDPPVILLASPTYLQAPERLDGFLQNVTGKDAFLDAVKECWLTQFLPEAVAERKRGGIDEFGMGVIVQQQLSGATAEGVYLSSLEVPIRVMSYLGLPDKSSGVTKDEHEIAVEHLQIRKSIIRQQPYKLYADEESGKLGQGYLQERGDEQKLTDKQVLEVGRLVKRVHILLQSDLDVLSTVIDEVASILFVLRRPAPKPVESAVDEVLDEVEDVPVVVVDDEQPVETYDEVPEVDERLPPLQTEEPETVPEPVPEAVVYEAEPVEEPVPEPVEAEPVEREETLFDLFEDDPSSQFVKGVHEKLTGHLESLHQEHYGRPSGSFQELLDNLTDAGALSLNRDDIERLNNAIGRVPEDHELGLAWRIDRSL